MTQPISVLITTGIFPPDIGGPATYVPRIARELSERGHRASVVCLSDVGSNPGEYTYEVMRIQRDKYLPFRLVKTVRAIVVRTRSADVIYSNGIRFESWMAGKLTGTPVVYKIVGDSAWERARNRGWYHGPIQQFQSAGSFRLRLLRLLRSFPLRRASSLIVPSQYLASLVQSWGVASELVRVVYNAVEKPIIDERSSGLPPFSGQTLVTVSRLVPWKRIEGLIELLRDLPDARLAIVGDGPLRERLMTHSVDAGVSDRVIFVGSVPAEYVGAFLRAADVFVLNSTYEGLPHVILEAMVQGTPVVATDAGGTSEVVKDGETGLLVPCYDRSSLLSAMRRLFDNPQLAGRLIAGARDMLEREFSFDRMLRQTEATLIDSARRS